MVVLAKPTAKKRERIADDLRALALKMAPGERFLSAPEIRRSYGVAAGTVEAAIETLREEGLLTRRRGSGTFVSRPANATPATDSNVLAVLAGYAGEQQLPYTRRVQDELMLYAARRGKRVVQHYVGYAPFLHGQDETVDTETTLGYARDMAAFHPFGYLLLMYLQAPVAKALVAQGQRAVILGVPPAGERPEVPCVYGDHELGGYLAAQRLLAAGHRRIAFVYSFRDPATFYGSYRWAGHCRALRDAGITETTLFDPKIFWDDADTFAAHFSQPDSPTGLVLWTDALLTELLPKFQHAGLRIPEDLSVVGYDNTPLPNVPIPLDSIDQGLHQQVEYATMLLENPTPVTSPPPVLVVSPSLITRGSVTAPRSSS